MLSMFPAKAKEVVGIRIDANARVATVSNSSLVKGQN